MTGKENYLNALLHKKTQWVPVEGEDLIYTGFEFNAMEKGPLGGGYDGFGVRWVKPDSGGGAAIPAPGEFLLNEENIVEWEKYVTIPDADAYHWEEDAKVQLMDIDRNCMAVDYGDGNGPFERLAALMGFENALMAIAVEPEAVERLLNAVTDYKIACLKHIVKYYKPDTYTLYDDVATQACTFMSPAAYRALIKPQHKRIVEEVKKLGIIPIIHCCGHAESLTEDFIEEGFAAWASVQPCNDIAGILEKYGDRFCIAGGYATNGAPARTTDTAVMRIEIERCLREYGKYKNYIFAGFILQEMDECESVEDVWAPTGMLCEEAVKYSHEHLEFRK